jgi:hypothetical protein
MTLSDFTVTIAEVQVLRRCAGSGLKAATSSRNAFSLARLRRVINWRTNAI